MTGPATRFPNWLRLERRPAGVVVDRGGAAQGLQLQPHDRLVIDSASQQGLLLLCPRGLGRPMLGRWSDGRLLAEPGSVPALCRRWEVVGSLVAVDRDPMRPRLGAAAGWVAVRGGDWGGDAGGVGPLGVPAVYLCARQGDVDVLCRQVSLLARRAGAAVAIAVGVDRSQALDLLQAAPAGVLRVAAACLSAPPLLQGRGEGGVGADRGDERPRQLRNRVPAPANRGRVAVGADPSSGRPLRAGGAGLPPQLPIPGLSPLP